MTIDSRHFDVVVIGAGLSGLASALLLKDAGLSVGILEAREKIGGRVQSIFDESKGIFLGDLGPTWIWPAHQPIVTRWLEKLALDTFPQFEEGNSILDHGPDQQPQIGFLPGQEGNMRIVGGSQAMIDAIASQIYGSSIFTECVVQTIRLNDDGLKVLCANDRQFTCERAIVAVPPRIISESMGGSDLFGPALVNGLQSISTWMAPHAKVVAVFDRPFWRAKGLSGRIVSHAGPIVEAHDHSGPDGSPAAIFGFIGWPHEIRAQAGLDLEKAVRDQMIRCFGTEASNPARLHIEDWSQNKFVTTPSDLSEPMHHPGIGPDVLRQACADNRIWFASAEVALQSPGLIEGAFDAAERAVSNLLRAAGSWAAD